jgi:RimJ/RimL family protein N-acetyltransferase
VEQLMRIETERLILREFREDDIPLMLDWWNDPRYQRYYAELTDPEPVVRDLAAMFVAAQSEEPRRKWQLAVTVRGNDQIVGTCGVRVNDAELAEANIGYELHPDQWGNGYATEAATAILRFGFAELGMHRIWAECVAENTGSARVLEKAGMRQEARFREHQYFRNRWWDTLIYAILASEWQERHAGA